MCRTNTIHTSAVRAEHREKIWHKVDKVDLAQSLHERSECPSGRRTRLWYWVDQHNTNKGHEFVQVRDKVATVRKTSEVSDNLSRLALRLSAALAQSTIDDRNQKGKRGRVDVMNEGGFEQGSESCSRLVVGIDKSLQERGHKLLDLRVANDLTELFQTAVGRRPHLRVRVGQDVAQARDDSRQGHGELAWSTVCHGTEELDSTLLGSPLLLFETSKQRRQDQLDAVAANTLHDHLGSVLRRLPDVRRGIAVASKQLRKDVDDVRLKQPTQRSRQGLVGKHCTLASLSVLLVLNCISKTSHDAELFDASNSSSHDQTCEAVGRTTTFSIPATKEQIVDQLLDQPWHVIADSTY